MGNVFHFIFKLKVAFIFVFCVILIFVECLPGNDLGRTLTRDEMRAYIKAEVAKCTSASEIWRNLKKIAGKNAYSKAQVCHLYSEFHDKGRTETCDLERSGRPPSATCDENYEALDLLMSESQAWRIEDLADELGISITSTWRMLHMRGYRKIASRWVPHDLTPAQRNTRYITSSNLLSRHSLDESFLGRIIAIDETWIRSYDPLDNNQARQWLLPSQEP